MRFHCGISFSLKKLKKFIFPILLGIFSYFFGDYIFGSYINVYATSYENYSTFYNITIPELDLTSFNIDSTHTFQEFLDTLVELGNNSTNYDLLIGTGIYPRFSDLSVFPFSITLSPKGIVEETGYNSYFGFNSSNNYFQFFNNHVDYVSFYMFQGYVGFSFTSYPFGNDYTTNSNFLKIKSCLEDNICDLTFSSYYNSLQSFELAHNKPFIDNNNSYTIDFSDTSTYYHTSAPFQVNGKVIYYSSFPIIFDNDNSYSDSRYSNYFKSLVINSVNYSPGDRIPTYCELFGLCSTSSPTLATYNKLDDLFVSNIPVNSYSNLEVKFSFDYFDSNFPDNFRIQGFYYGRVNNGTYYSYEPISCSLVGGSAYGDFKLRGTYNITSCLGDLSRYDSLIVRLRMTTLDLINNFTFSSNLGYINKAPVYNGSNSVEIMDYFGGLSPDFSILISSTEQNSRLEYIGNSTYTLAQRINKGTNDISSLSNTGVITFGTNTNSNIMLYNYSLENNTNTDLYLFFSEGVIISFSDNGSYTYYNDSNTITTESITIKYLIDVSQYDSSSFIDIIDNFINDLDTSMVDMHILLNNIYNSLPSFLNYLILALYTLFLLYLLFKILKR